MNKVKKKQKQVGNKTIKFYSNWRPKKHDIITNSMCSNQSILKKNIKKNKQIF